LLGRLSNRKAELRGDLDLCRQATAASDDLARLPELRWQLEQFGRTILHDVTAALQVPTDQPDFDDDELQEIVALLIQGLVLAEARVQELLVSAGAPLAWMDMTVQEFVREIQGAVSLITIDRRWDVVFTKDEHTDRSYLVTVSVMSPSVDRVSLPPVLPSLLAYLVLASVQRTKPGGVVTISVEDDGEVVGARVRDPGRGMPLDQLNARVREIMARGESQSEATHLIDSALAILTILAGRGAGASKVQAVPGGETIVGIRLVRAGESDGGEG
jgi:signal transduction histidine kinase